MKITLDTVEGLPDAIKPLASDDGGKFSLDLSQLVPVSEYERFKAKAVTAEGEAIERRKALKAWEALGGNPDEVRAKLEKGADPEIVAQLRKQVDETKADYSARLTRIMRERHISDMKAELARAGVVPEGLDLLAGFAAQHIQIDEDGGARIIGRDGKPMVGSAENGGATLADLAKQLAAGHPRLVADTGAGGGGKPPASGGKSQGKVVTAAELDQMTPQQKAAFFRANPGVTVAT